jgi:hypothetical protein
VGIYLAVEDVKEELVNEIDKQNRLAMNARSPKMNRYYIGKVHGLMMAIEYVDANERYDKRDSGAVQMRPAAEIIQEVRNASS